MRTTMMVGMTALLFALPVAAQQATPQTPASSGTAAPSGPGAGPMGGPGVQRMMGGMRMMGRPEMHDIDNDDDDDDDRRTGPRRGWRHDGGRGTPMQVIINIGPDNRVEFEQPGPRGAGPMGGPRMMGGEWRGRSMAEGVAARLDDLRDELRLTPEQQPSWDRFASAVREAAGRMRPSPDAMAQGQTLEQRLAAHEAMLTAHLETVRAVRGALSGLTGSLNDVQRHTLDEHAAVFMPGMGRMQSGMR